MNILITIVTLNYLSIIVTDLLNHNMILEYDQELINYIGQLSIVIDDFCEDVNFNFV